MFEELGKAAFLFALQQTNLRWGLVESGMTRCQRIRVVQGIQEDHCPLTAVCLQQTGQEYSSMDYQIAAEELSLSAQTAAVVVFAADDSELHSNFGIKEIKSLREALLFACGLHPQVNRNLW